MGETIHGYIQHPFHGSEKLSILFLHQDKLIAILMLYGPSRVLDFNRLVGFDFSAWIK
jgi:hypothetical protein